MSFFLGKCRCGCNEDIPIRNKMRYVQTFKHGHNGRGENNYNWKGGRAKHTEGYIEVYKPDHIHARKKGYVYEHRLVWEQNHNASLLPWADVHHKDGNRANNVWYNLFAIMHHDHGKMHSVEYWHGNRINI